MDLARRGPKRTRIQREADLVRISELYLRGKRQADIAEMLSISRQQVGYDLAEIQRRWSEQTTFNLDAAKQRELARIDLLERTYWDAWERSCGEKVKTRESTNDVGIGQVGLEKELLPGNPAFLGGVQWCIETRCKLLGLNAPVRTELTGRDGGSIQYRQEHVFDHASAAATIAARSGAYNLPPGADESGELRAQVGEDVHGGRVRADNG